MSGYNIGEGFKEMFRTFKTGKGYERRKREERYKKEQREFKRKKREELESKRKALQSEIRRVQKNKENRKNYTIETSPGGRKMKVIRIENKDGTTTIRKTPIYDDNTKTDTKKQTKTISPKGGNIDDMSFAEAFKSSKSAGKKEFTWRGNKYHTRTKEEEAKKYEEGGVSAPKGYHWMKKGDGKYKIMKHGDKPFKPHKGASLKAKFPIQKKHNTKYEEGGEIQRHQSPGFQTMFEIGSKMNLFGGGPASERAKMRHERKMARQEARADRKMVRTEGRQERRADRLAGRQEAGSRRQDRRDARQESRLGYYQKGGKTPRIKKKDRPTAGELDELLYEIKSQRLEESNPVANLQDISLTTNGYLLSKKKANELFKNGLDRITVSLDAIDPDIFSNMIGEENKIIGKEKLFTVLEGIDHAINAGFNPKAGKLKINAVIKKEINDI